MKTRVILTLCVVFVWGLVSNANAQVIAGSPEDKAFQKIDAENSVDSKVALLLDFERQFQQSKSVREAYLQLIQIYQQKNDQMKVIQYCEKAAGEIAKMKSQPPQQGYTDEQWKQYVDSNDQLAKSYLAYARSLK